MRVPRFWRRRKRDHSNASTTAGEGLDPLLAASQPLRKRREQRDLTLRDLSRDMKITTPVLEALEKGWRDRLPEAAYLGTMLSRLEHHLDLAAGSLSGALPPSQPTRLSGGQRGIARFTIGSVDIFTTWQGSVVYALVMVGSLLVLNQQQRHLAQRNSLSLEPIAPNRDNLQMVTPAATDLALKGLRPLDEALRRPLTQQLPPVESSDTSKTRHGLGLLDLRLDRPSTIRFSSAGGDRSQLNGAQGTLSLQLLAPFSLSIEPPPKNSDQVLWNGTPLAADKGKPGDYRLPQTAPRSP